jgi:hypothetical protein
MLLLMFRLLRGGGLKKKHRPLLSSSCGQAALAVVNARHAAIPKARVLVHEVLDHGTQAVFRGAARCASQVLGRGTQAVARGAARQALQGLNRIAQANACGAVKGTWPWFPGRCPRRRYARPLPAARLVVHRSYLIVLPRPLPAAPLVVHRRYSIVLTRPLPAAPQVVRRSAQADARGAAKEVGRGAQADARGGARYATKVLG